ncbi:MAG: hypothetical protein I8H77_04340 [Comamonadaceae bacterium]|nr:hypothetical protein [Comamonadaceae bacterium]
MFEEPDPAPIPDPAAPLFERIPVPAAPVPEFGAVVALGCSPDITPCVVLAPVAGAVEPVWEGLRIVLAFGCSPDITPCVVLAPPLEGIVELLPGWVRIVLALGCSPLAGPGGVVCACARPIAASAAAATRVFSVLVIVKFLFVD